MPEPPTCYGYGTMLARAPSRTPPVMVGCGLVWVSVTLRDFKAIHLAAEHGMGGKDSRLGDEIDEKQGVRVVAHATVLESMGVSGEDTGASTGKEG